MNTGEGKGALSTDTNLKHNHLFPRPVDTEDPEFEPSAEMLVHDDMDDELTLQEEEEMAEPQEVEEEVQNLQEVCCAYLCCLW